MTIAKMTKRLVTEIRTTPQCTYRPAGSLTILKALTTVTFFTLANGYRDVVDNPQT